MSSDQPIDAAVRVVLVAVAKWHDNVSRYLNFTFMQCISVALLNAAA